MKIVYSVPNYLVISGGLSCRFGKPALVIANDKERTSMTIANATDQKFDREIGSIEIWVKKYLMKHNNPIVQRNYQILWAKGGSPVQKTVLAIACLSEFYTGKRLPFHTINDLAFGYLKKNDNSLLGYETSSCIYGGLIYFRQEFPFLKTMSKLNFKLSPKLEESLYVYRIAKNNEKTQKDMSDSYNKQPKELAAIFGEMEKTTKQIVLAIAKEDNVFFQKTLGDEKKLLKKLGVKTHPVVFKQAISGLRRE